MNLLKIILSVFLVLPLALDAQVNDDFTDGDFTIGQVWSGDDADWTIAGGELRTNGPAVTPTTLYLSTSSATATSAQWEFYVNPKCATSSGNFMIISLISDQANIEGNYNGYYVMVGNTNDEISLYRKDGGTNTMIIDGTNSIVSSSSNNPFKIKVIRDASNNWSLETDNTGTGSNYVLQGNVNDATHLTSSFFGVSVTYSAANNTKYFFDNFYAGPIIFDTTPPAVISATAMSATQLDVLFDEAVELTTAQTASNYSVNNGIGTASAAVRDGMDPKLVHLTFGTSFVSPQSYTVTVNNVTDGAGNAIVNGMANFTYVLIDTAAYREVIINEIFADPSPQIGLPGTEFIEIHNRSTSYFQLAGWTFTDGSATGTLGAQVIGPGEYIILCANADLATYSAFGTTIGLSTWPSLNNTGDTLTLKNQLGTSIDQVIYSDSWYQDVVKDDGGYTLELINPTLDCSGANNWIASNDASGGTPGTQNSTYSNAPDVALPVWVSLTVVSQNSLQLTFSESMDSASLVNATFSLSGGIGISSRQPVAPDFTQMNLIVSPLLDSSLAYTLTMSGANDCVGNTMMGDTMTFGIGVAAEPFEVVINELFPDPDGSTTIPETEFIEIYNTTNRVLNLNGYKLSDATSAATISNAVIFPNDYLIVCAAANTGDYIAYGNTVGISSFPSLNNSGDNMQLRKPDGTLIHAVNYSDDWYQDAFKQLGGWTLEMIDPANPCGEENNWRASVNPNGGTPGSVNSVNAVNPDVTAPAIELAEAFDNVTVILHFDERMDSLSLVNANYTIDNGVSVIAHSVSGDRIVVLTVSPALQYNIIYHAGASLCEDCVGNPVSSVTASFALPEQAQPGDLIINEVLFDPRESGADFVEIYNNSQRIISMKDWYLANYSNDTVSNHKLVSSTIQLIFPGEYLVLTIDKNNVVSEYPLSHTDRFLEMGSLPTYSNDAGRVILIDNMNRISDDFAYTDDMHFALLSSFDGISLERIDFNRSSQDITNWHSAAEAVGYATPGYQNSQYLPDDAETVLNVSPETFSPDNDGYNDVVNISYTLDQPGYVGNITVYDATGRVVKLLMQNELLGINGTISWDGINEKREKANVGIYVVYFEFYDLNGKVKHYKKPLVVAAKF